MSASKQNEETNRKIKIRKVTVDSIEFFGELDSLLKAFESIPGKTYSGCTLSLICKNLGIQELDFWKIKLENEPEFEKRYMILKAGFDEKNFFVWRLETYEKKQS